MKAAYAITALLVVIGGLNWGLVGFLGFDLVAALLGQATLLSRTVYGLVGILAIVQAVHLTAHQRESAVERS